jgi:hypothetical protein
MGFYCGYQISGAAMACGPEMGVVDKRKRVVKFEPKLIKGKKALACFTLHEYSISKTF